MVASQLESHTVLDLSNTEVVGLNPIQRVITSFLNNALFQN